ncbi:MAG: TOMM precursor leader peptide-binding protein [Marmoricola sp.]
MPGRCLVVPDDAAHRTVLEALRTADLLPSTPEAEELLPLLRSHGLVRVAGPRPAPIRTVDVVGDLGVDPDPLLAGSGLGRGGRRATAGSPRPTLLLRTGEVNRDHLDTLVRSGVPHLVVRVVDGAPVLGPLVVPGQTACLRCIDAHRGDDDPAHRAVVERYVAAPAAPGGDPAPAPSVATLLTCWAAHQLAAFLDGVRPTTWSTTLSWDPTFVDLTATTWCRHPACGCSWDADVGPSGRIGA